MADTSFIHRQTPITADWLNDVNNIVYRYDASSTYPAGVGEFLNRIYARTASEIAAGVTPTNYAYLPGDVRRYGAVGDGSTDDFAAIQAALNSGAKEIVFPPGTYRCSASPRVTTSGQRIIGYGATLVANAKSVSGLHIGYNGATFVKTDNVTVEGLTFTGAQDGSGSTESWCVVIQPPTTVPYSQGIGCSSVRVMNCRGSGHTGGVAATCADDLEVSGCRFGSMKYMSAVSAGGYGVLFQTCFDVRVISNSFVATSGDRHAVYVSADPGRTKDNNNVCKGVVIDGNTINWTGAVATTGFEAAIVLRSPENCTIKGNTIRGGYGGIVYEGENGNGRNLVIEGNTIDAPTSSGSERACVGFTRTTGSYIITGVVINGNTMRASGANLYNVSVAHADQVSIEGNTLSQTNGVAPIQFGGNVTNAYVGGGSIKASSSNSVYYFSGTGNDSITINMSQRSVSGSNLYNFVTTPANLRHGFTRSAAIRANSTGSPVILSDPDGILSSVGTDANGITATFANQVSDVTSTNVLFGTLNSNIVNAYYRSVAGQQVTIGVLSASGAPVPAASNNYDITIFLRS